MAHVERESNNSDEIQLTNTPEKDNANRGRKKVRKINNKKRKRRSSSTSPLLVAVGLCLAQVATRSVRVK